MPLHQHPNRRVVPGRPGSFGRRLVTAQKPANQKTPTTAKNYKPTIRGWQNYTGNTMGPVGQYSRVPGFGRKFRG